MTEKEIKKYILDLALEIHSNWDSPRFSTAGLIIDHFNTIPNHMLYRYRTCNENEFNVLEEKSIYLSQASNFKDKLDSAIYYDYENLTKKQKEVLVKSYFLANYCNAYIQFNGKGKKEMPHPKIVKKFIEKCYDKNFNLIQKKFDKFIKKNHNGNEFYFKSKLLELDKIFSQNGRGKELQDWLLEKEKKDAISITKERQSETFACSFTEIYNNLSMWENYANNYSGFCVGYQLEGVYTNHLANPLLRACMLQIFPMIYTDKTNVHNGYDFSIEQDNMMYNKAIGKEENFDWFWYYYMIVAMLNKKNSYSWEKEWRVVLFNLKDNKVYFPFATCIYLGKDILKSNKEKLIKIARKNNLSVYQQRLDEAKGEYFYDLIIPRISEPTEKMKKIVVAGNPLL